MDKLPLRWVDNLKKPEDRNSFFDTLKNNRFVLKRLKEILEEEMEKLGSFSNADYDSPSWAYKQADLIGQKRQLQKVLDLLSFI